MGTPKVFEHFEFWPGLRRQVELIDWDPLKNAQSEKRLKLTLLMPLTGTSLTGMPNFIRNEYECMEKEKSQANDIDIMTELEGVTCEAFSTETSKHPIAVETMGIDLTKEQLGHTQVKFTSATLRNFKMVRVTKDKQAIVCLQFNVTLKRDKGLLLWADTYEDAQFWMLFTETQPSIPTPPKDDKQMLLGDGSKSEGEKPPAKSNGNGKDHAEAHDPSEDCGYVDGQGNRCILARHEKGKHELAPITEGDVVHRAKSRTEKEREAVASGKPRGFAN